MPSKDELAKRFDELKPGDIEAHIALAKDLIEAKLWNPDVAESMGISASVAKPAEFERYRAAVRDLLN